MAASNGLLRHVPEGYESRVLAGADKIEAAKLIIDAATKERDRLRMLLERVPKINTENVDEDIRCVLGAIKALNAVIELPQAARDRIGTNKE